jgi:hypothetical protein
MLTKFNCITLKISSKADFKSRSQNIWQQIILIIAHAQCSVDENIYIYIFPVYHMSIIAKNNWFTWHETDRFLNNYCQECVRAYLSIHDCLSFLHEVMIGNQRNKTTKVNQSPHNGEDDKHAHGLAEFYLLRTLFDLKHAWIA